MKRAIPLSLVALFFVLTLMSVSCSLFQDPILEAQKKLQVEGAFEEGMTFLETKDDPRVVFVLFAFVQSPPEWWLLHSNQQQRKEVIQRVLKSISSHVPDELLVADLKAFISSSTSWCFLENDKVIKAIVFQKILMILDEQNLPDWQELLVKWSESSNGELVRSVVWQLGNYANSDTIGQLFKSLTHSDSSVRIQALYSLVALSENMDIPDLEAAVLLKGAHSSGNSYLRGVSNDEFNPGYRKNLDPSVNYKWKTGVQEPALPTLLKELLQRKDERAKQLIEYALLEARERLGNTGIIGQVAEIADPGHRIVDEFMKSLLKDDPENAELLKYRGLKQQVFKHLHTIGDLDVQIVQTNLELAIEKMEHASKEDSDLNWLIPLLKDSNTPESLELLVLFLDQNRTQSSKRIEKDELALEILIRANHPLAFDYLKRYLGEERYPKADLFKAVFEKSDEIVMDFLLETLTYPKTVRSQVYATFLESDHAIANTYGSSIQILIHAKKRPYSHMGYAIEQLIEAENPLIDALLIRALSIYEGEALPQLIHKILEIESDQSRSALVRFVNNQDRCQGCRIDILKGLLQGGNCSNVDWLGLLRDRDSYLPTIYAIEQFGRENIIPFLEQAAEDEAVMRHSIQGYLNATLHALEERGITGATDLMQKLGWSGSGFMNPIRPTHEHLHIAKMFNSYDRKYRIEGNLNDALFSRKVDLRDYAVKQLLQKPELIDEDMIWEHLLADSKYDMNGIADVLAKSNPVYARLPLAQYPHDFLEIRSLSRPVDERFLLLKLHQCAYQEERSYSPKDAEKVLLNLQDDDLFDPIVETILKNPQKCFCLPQLLQALLREVESDEFQKTNSLRQFLDQFKSTIGHELGDELVSYHNKSYEKDILPTLCKLYRFAYDEVTYLQIMKRAMDRAVVTQDISLATAIVENYPNIIWADSLLRLLKKHSSEVFPLFNKMLGYRGALMMPGFPASIAASPGMDPHELLVDETQELCPDAFDQTILDLCFEGSSFDFSELLKVRNIAISASELAIIDRKMVLLRSEIKSGERSLIHDANTHYQSGDFDRAIQGYLQVIELNPTHQEAMNNLVLSLMYSGKTTAALILNEWLYQQTGGTYLAAVINRYVLLRKFAITNDARETIQKGYERFPNQPPILYNYAYQQFEDADFIGCRKTLKPLLRQYPLLFKAQHLDRIAHSVLTQKMDPMLLSGKRAWD